MISVEAVWAVVLRHLRMLRRDPNCLLTGFYWPVLDILIWGFLGSWIAQSQMAEFQNYETVALLGILLWQVVGRGSNYLLFALAKELWSRNLVNLFSLPLRITDWMIGVTLFYAIMMALVSCVCLITIFLLYDVSLWKICSNFLIFMPPLFFSGLWLGFSCLQLVITLGRRGTELGFVCAWLLLPFSGAYYPIEVLPAWAQSISAFLPMSYVFQGMRAHLMYQQSPTGLLIKGYLLGLLYAAAGAILFVYCFHRSKQRGLVRLAD